MLYSLGNTMKPADQVCGLKFGSSFHTKRELTGEYIAGLVQADGSFSAALGRKIRGDKEYLSLSFTIVQNQVYKDLILEIQKKWGNIGH